MLDQNRVREMAELEATLEAAHRFSTAFLAFERFNGRTEETYDREKARKELDEAVKGLAGLRLPEGQLAVYHGLREFRKYLGLDPVLAVEDDVGTEASVETSTEARTEPMKTEKRVGVRAVMKKIRNLGMEP